MLQRLQGSTPSKYKISSALGDLLKGMRARYVLALLSVAMLSGVSYVGFHNIIEAEETSGSVINVSGRQRMLSQRIPMLAQMIASAPDHQQKTELISKIDHAITLMETSHYALVHGNPKMGVIPLRSDAVRILLYGKNTLLAARLMAFFEHARQFSIKAKGGKNHIQLTMAANTLALMGERLLPALDEVVGVFEEESQDTISNLKIWQLGVFLATLAVLITEGAIIFWPLEKELNRSFRLLLQSRGRARKAQTEASRANRAKSEFLANMSHELRTPLNAINGFSEMMKVEAFGPLGCDQYREYSADILDSGRNLLRLIDDILDISQIESGTVRLSEDIVDIKTIMSEVRTMFLTTASQDQIGIVIQDFSVPQLLADAERIRDILLNLVSNAVRFSHVGGEVQLAAKWSEEGGISIIVRDQGIGIDSKEQQEVLEPFSQIESAYTRGHGGSGLGLTICNSLMKMHGGALIINSTLGEGTEVLARFPSERTLL